MRGTTNYLVECPFFVSCGDEFIVFASTEIIMRAKVDELDAWELLSKDGVVLTAPDYEHGGKVRTIIVYYVYYRK